MKPNHWYFNLTIGMQVKQGRGKRRPREHGYMHVPEFIIKTELP